MSITTNSKIVRITVTPSGTAYDSGDTVGTTGGAGNDAGKLIIKNATRHPTHTGILNSLCLIDLTYPYQNVPLEVYIYSAKPQGDYADNAAWPGIMDGNDESRILGVVEITADDYINGFVQKTGLGIVVEADSQDTLYASIRLAGAATYSQEMYLIFGFLQD